MVDEGRITNDGCGLVCVRLEEVDNNRRWSKAHNSAICKEGYQNDVVVSQVGETSCDTISSSSKLVYDSDDIKIEASTLSWNGL